MKKTKNVKSLKNEYVLVDKKLLGEILEELEKINGLDAIKDYGYCGIDYSKVYTDDIIELDFDDIIVKMKMIL